MILPLSFSLNLKTKTHSCCHLGYFLQKESHVSVTPPLLLPLYFLMENFTSSSVSNLSFTLSISPPILCLLYGKWSSNEIMKKKNMEQSPVYATKQPLSPNAIQCTKSACCQDYSSLSFWFPLFDPPPLFFQFATSPLSGVLSNSLSIPSRLHSSPLPNSLLVLQPGQWLWYTKLGVRQYKIKKVPSDAFKPCWTSNIGSYNCHHAKNNK